MYKIYYSEDSLNDLKDIVNYISLDNLFFANKVINNIYDSIELLEKFPFIWKERKDNLREIVEPNYWYRIIYKIDLDNTIINIVSIFKYKNSY